MASLKILAVTVLSASLLTASPRPSASRPGPLFAQTQNISGDIAYFRVSKEEVRHALMVSA